MINDLYVYEMSNMQKQTNKQKKPQPYLFPVTNLISQISFYSAGGDGGEMKRNEPETLVK